MRMGKRELPPPPVFHDVIDRFNGQPSTAEERKPRLTPLPSSTIHQITLLTRAGESPQTRIGSHKTRFSHIAHKFGRREEAANSGMAFSRWGVQGVWEPSVPPFNAAIEGRWTGGADAGIYWLCS